MIGALRIGGGRMYSAGNSASQADAKRVLDVIDEEVNAVSTGDAQAYLAILADDAVFMPPNQTSKAGDELRIWLREFLEEFSVKWLKFEHLDTETAGDLAYHTYAFSWRVTPKVGGEPTVAQGKGMHVLRRQADGAWKVVREIWNASPPTDGKP
jgi:ketosteroid isomerase-like protein